MGIDNDTYRKWIEYQMTPEMIWSNIEIDHLKLIHLFDISNNDELKEAFCWKNTQPLLEKIHQQKGLTFNFLIINYNSLKHIKSSDEMKRLN